MGQVHFISDPHFGHKNMANRRGFKDVHEHDEHIVKCWNEVVHKKDVVYLLGDVTMEKDNYWILDQLKGIKNVILGNHDKKQHVKSLLNYVNSVSGMINYKGNVILTHCPIHPNELQHRFTYNIHGHVHENSIDDKRYINVSAEAVDYYPRTLEALLKMNKI